MNINPISSSDAISKYKYNAAKIEKKAEGVSHADKVELSDEALAFLPALKMVKDTDDVRMNKVDLVRRKIELWQYNIEDDDVVDSIMKGAYINIRL